MLYVFTFGRGRYACAKGTIYQDLFIYIKIYIYTSRLIDIHQDSLIYTSKFTYMHQDVLYTSKFIDIYIYIYQDLVKSN